MKTRVADILQIPSLREAVVLAGKHSVHRHVRWVHSSDILDISPWLFGGEIILTTSRTLLTTEIASAYIGALADAKVAGLISAESANRTDDIVQVITTSADELHLPVISVPAAVPFVEIAREISHLIISQQREHIEMWEYTARSLTSTLLAGQGARGLVQAIARLLTVPVFLFSPTLEVLYMANERQRGWSSLDVRRIQGIEFKPCDPENRPPHQAKQYSAVLRLSGQRACIDLSLHPVMNGTSLAAYFGMPAEHEIASSTLFHYALDLLSLTLSWEHRTKDLQRLVQSKLLEAILNEPDTNGSDLEVRLRLAGINLDDRFMVLATAEPDGNDPGPSVVATIEPLLTAYTTRMHPDALLIRYRKGWMIFVPMAESASLKDISRLAEQAIARLKPVAGVRLSIGMSLPAVGAGQLRTALDQAQAAAKLGAALHGPGSITPYEMLGPYQLFCNGKHPAQNMDLAEYVDRHLGNIDAFDARHTSDLLLTAQAYFDNFGNIRKTAGQLHIHRNTLYKRLAMIEHVTGLDLQHPEERLGLELALRLRMVLR